MDVRERLGIRVAKLRAAQGLSQTQLAALLGHEKLGVRQSYVSELEKGEKNPNLTTLDAIARAFDLPLKTLLDFE